MHSQWNLNLDLHKTAKMNQVSDYICIRRRIMAQIVHEKTYQYHRISLKNIKCISYAPNTGNGESEPRTTCTYVLASHGPHCPRIQAMKVWKTDQRKQLIVIRINVDETKTEKVSRGQPTSMYWSTHTRCA